MEYSTANQFVILALNPGKGRVLIDSIHFRYSLTGAILMDYLDGEELRVEDKRVIPSLKINNDAIHVMFSGKVSGTTRNRKISYWIRILTNKSRFIFSELTKSLEEKRIIRIEQKKFLHIIPYKRYWFLNNSIRPDLIEKMRGILMYGNKPEKKELMLLSVIHSAKAHAVFSKERGEKRMIRKKCAELLKGDFVSIEISQTIREVQNAIDSSITAASIATHNGY
jgi:hypothetical protein